MAANNPVTPIAASSEYRGPRDVGRAESLYRSALTKPDMDYSSQLLFSLSTPTLNTPAPFTPYSRRFPNTRPLAARC